MSSVIFKLTMEPSGVTLANIFQLDVQKLLIFHAFLSSSKDLITEWFFDVRSSVRKTLSGCPYSFVLLANTLYFIW